jgi:hypothetical protein
MSLQRKQDAALVALEYRYQCADLVQFAIYIEVVYSGTAPRRFTALHKGRRLQQHKQPTKTHRSLSFEPSPYATSKVYIKSNLPTCAIADLNRA